MECCRQDLDQAGYATPAAMVFSLALALVAAAFVGRSVGQLRLARADLERTQTEYALAGAHLAAAAEVVRSTKVPPFHWSFATDVGLVDATAAPQSDLLGLAASSRLDDATLQRFEIADLDGLRTKLAAAANGDPGLDIATLDDAPLWRACAGQMISPFGSQTTFTYQPPTEPGLGLKPASWRIGEVWRIVITTGAGWRDARIMRFTGDARHPAATVVREFTRSHKGGTSCEAILRASSVGTSTATP